MPSTQVFVLVGVGLASLVAWGFFLFHAVQQARREAAGRRKRIAAIGGPPERPERQRRRSSAAMGKGGYAEATTWLGAAGCCMTVVFSFWAPRRCLL